MAATKTRASDKTAPVTYCELILKLRPARLDEALIRRAIGGATLPTQAAVAREFGLAANTIKQSWASEGMPGRRGSYPLADILIWRLKHLADIEGRRNAFEDLLPSQIERQQAEEQLRKIKLQNDRLEREELIASAKVIDREQAATAAKTLLAVFAERLMKLPCKWEPFYPLQQAAAWVEMQTRDIRRELAGLAESMGRDVLKQGQADDL